MRKATTATGALALVLALTLAGCGSNDPEPASSSGMEQSESAMAVDPSASAMDDSMESEDTMEDDSMESEDAMEDDSMESEDESMAKEGAWIDQAAYEADPAKYHDAGDVVLFFNATWCPTCRTTVKSLDADGSPAGLTVVSVDYDSNAALKRTYGVTVQHTFVQVDEAGEELAKFTGSSTGEAIAAKTA